ncbi:suppressor of fused domain protein [Gorillibacterium sp. CAU 1737]|uniref:suppressor of fused domain protein n=1 Tax=Gorillibacterium sp. CAU 1737 TaxID=3140362 RepID=UPI0032602092
MIHYGELYYDHYSTYLREPSNREVFTSSNDLPSIQVLMYENVFEECRVFNSLGFSKVEDIVGMNAEVSMVVDGAFDLTGYLLASALFVCIHNKIQMGRGIAIKGLEKLDQAFVQTYNKSAIYFTDPYAFPDEYRHVRTPTGEREGRVLLAFFITESECEYFTRYGADAFEDLLEEKDVDPFQVNRESVI